MLRAFLDFLTVRLKEQRMCVKFYFRIRKTASETREMVQTAADDNAMWSRQAFIWDSGLKYGGLTSVEDQQPLR